MQLDSSSQRANVDSPIIASTNFSYDQKENGWMKLEVTTNADFDDEDQAIAAGIAEGYITGYKIT